MTREDTENLWKLLGIYRRDDPHLQNRKLLSAWYLVLKPFDPGDVRNAVAAYFRRSKFWPDVTDIAARCPALEPDKPKPMEPRQCGGFSAAEFANCDAQMDEMLELGALMERDYTAAGIPHPSEARAMGWSCRDWMDRIAGKTEGPSTKPK